MMMCNIFYKEKLRTDVNNGVFIKNAVVSSTSERKMVISTPLNDSSINAKQRKFSSVGTSGFFISFFPKYGREITVFSGVSKVKSNLEGIVLIRSGETREEREEFRKKYHNGFVPFIPVKDPEKKLRDLNFSFEYPDNVRKVGGQSGQRGVGPVYNVIGLKKAKTREERLDAMRFSTGKELPLASKMEREERERLWPKRRRKK